MSLKETIIYHLDLFMILFGVIIFVSMLLVWGTKKFYQSSLALPFKTLVSVLILVSGLYVAIFSVAMYHVLFDTSFFNHIQSGDLGPHLRIGLGL